MRPQRRSLQDVDAAERGHHPFIGPADFVRLGHVAGESGDFALGGRFDRPPCRFQRRGVARQDGDIGAGRGEARRHGEAEPLAAAGDEGGSPAQGNLHGISFS